MTPQKKVLLTGGAGFIGSHTAVELIAQGHEVVILDDLSRSEDSIIEGVERITNQKVKFIKGNCNDEDLLAKIFEMEKVQSVIHFAAYKSVNESVEQPLLYYKNNIGSVVALLNQMRKHDVNEIIFSSSCTVYGQPDIIPVDERAPFKKAESPYGATKQMCERILEDEVAANQKLKLVSLRYFNPIGAHPSALIGELPIGTPTNLVPFITQTAAGIRQVLTVFGDDYDTKDGSCIRDFIHVVDLAKAHVRALQVISSLPNRQESFNLGTGLGVTVLEVVNKFIKVTGINLAYKIGTRRAGDIEKIYADVTKANKILNWQSEQSLENSLLHAWNWEKKIRGIE